MCEGNNNKQKTFSSFNDIDEVCDIFGYEYQLDSFICEKAFEINNYLKSNLLEDFADMKSFANEIALCESIIRPILADVARANKLPLFSWRF